MANKLQELRRANFRLLLVAIYTTQQEFGQAIGLNQTRVSQINMGDREIDDRFARKLEREFGKPTGWMDRDNFGIGLTAEEFALIIATRTLALPARLSLLQFLEAVANAKD